MRKVITGWMEPSVDIGEHMDYKCTKISRYDLHLWVKPILDTEAQATITIEIPDNALSQDQMDMMLKEGWEK